MKSNGSILFADSTGATRNIVTALKGESVSLNLDQSKNQCKTTHNNLFAVFGSGTVIGLLGGLIGLGGAEFRLPLLIGMFSFGPLEAVILNKAMSLIVVAVALPEGRLLCRLHRYSRTGA